MRNAFGGGGDGGWVLEKRFILRDKLRYDLKENFVFKQSHLSCA